MMNGTAEEQTRSHLSALARKGRIPGMQYVVVTPEGIRFEAVSGVMDVSTGHSVTPDTTFMASSVTKTLTAAAVLQLHDRGQLDLAASLGTYYPDHPYGSALRIEHLVNQSSGVPNPMPLRWLHLAVNHDDYDEDAALKDVLARHAKLRFSPGTRYAYSNLSYWLLGKVIERVSGRSYAEYMRRNIFDALEIGSDEMSCVIPDPERHACGHLKRWSVLGLLMPRMMMDDVFGTTAAGKRRFQPVYMNGPAYGGLIGTARAFARFLQDQLRPSSALFGDKTRELFYSEQADSHGRVMETTLGWHRGELRGAVYYGKPGGGPGFQSNVRIYPAQGIATAWLANEMAASEGPILALSDRLDRHFI